MNGLVTAIRTLTILPFPGKDADDMASSLPWFPIVGLLLGGILYGVAILPIGWPQGAAVLTIIAGVLLTRGLHLDGLADWADGFWGGRDKESILRIMKDSSVGAFGATALICALLAKWVCLQRLIETNSHIWIIMACVTSRTMQVVLAVTNPYARDDSGTATSFVKNANFRHMAVALGLAAVIVLVVGQLNWMWLGVPAGAWFIARLFGQSCKRVIGGVTGDLLGAGNEIVELAILAVGALIASSQ